MMPRGRSYSKHEGDSRRERSMSISSRSSSDGEHSSMSYKKRKTESQEHFRDLEKSRNRSARSFYRHGDPKSKGDDYSDSDFDDSKSIEEPVDPSICNFRGSTLQDETVDSGDDSLKYKKDSGDDRLKYKKDSGDDRLKYKKDSGNDRLKQLEKIMAKIVQNSRTPSEHSRRHYGTQEDDRDSSNSRLNNLEKMIQKIVKNKAEKSTFTVLTKPNGPVTSEELIPHNSNFTTSMWLNKVNEECLERSFDEKTCIKFLESKMTGSLKSWYKTLGSNDLTWPELKMLITQTFPDNSDFAATLRLLVNRLKKPEETITQYYFSKMYLIEACRISGVFAVSCLIDGLLDPKVKRDAKAHNFLNPESLYAHYLDKLPNQDEPDHKDKMYRLNHKDELDQSNHKGDMDQSNHKGQKDRPNHVGVMNRPNHKAEMDRSNHNDEMNHPIEYEKGHPRQANFSNYEVEQPIPPNYRMEQSYFEDEFRIRGPSHPNFGPDYGMGQSHQPRFEMGPPHPPSFEMDPFYEMEPWQPNPYLKLNNPYPNNPEYMNEPPRNPFLKCRKCQKRGHFAAECWTTCFICSEKGHISASCPNKKEVAAKKEDPKESKMTKESEKPKKEALPKKEDPKEPKTTKESGNSKRSK